jgi:predicted nucleic acid-binding protein
MSHFYLDASALVKRYAHERGTEWIQTLTDPVRGNVILASRLALAEVAAALAAKHRAPGGLSRGARDRAMNLFLGHCRVEYGLIEVDETTSDLAVRLTQDHRLRGYDAMHLATAVLVDRALLRAGVASLKLVASDEDLLTAARAEGLATVNPELQG